MGPDSFPSISPDGAAVVIGCLPVIIVFVIGVWAAFKDLTEPFDTADEIKAKLKENTRSLVKNISYSDVKRIINGESLIIRIKTERELDGVIDGDDKKVINAYFEMCFKDLKYQFFQLFLKTVGKTKAEFKENIKSLVTDISYLEVEKIIDAAHRLTEFKTFQALEGLIMEREKKLIKDYVQSRFTDLKHEFLALFL